MMHRKRRRIAPVVFISLLAALVIGSFGALMMANVPAPTHSIEKPLDAKTFLGAGQ